MTEAGSFQPAAAQEPSPTRDHRSFVERLGGVLRLDGSAYEEVGADPSAIGQAALVAFAAAAGRAASAVGGPFSTQGLLFLVQISLLWPVSALLVFGLGRVFGIRADFGRTLRVMGFALAPFGLAVLGVVPVEAVQIAVAFLSTALLLATTVVGIRHALRVDTARAALVMLVVLLTLVFVSMVYGYLSA